MVNARDVRKQLRRIGADYHFWGVPEIRELPHILFDNETIYHLNNGRYSGGFATLCATNLRVLLIDKKPLFLTLEDIRYDMVSDVLFNHRVLNASLVLGTVHNSISFIGFNKTRLRQMTNFIQERVMEYRKHQAMQQLQTIEATTGQPLEEQPVAWPTLPEQLREGLAPTMPPAAPPDMEMPQAADQERPINPYKMPVTIRRRVGRIPR